MTIIVVVVTVTFWSCLARRWARSNHRRDKNDEKTWMVVVRVLQQHTTSTNVLGWSRVCVLSVSRDLQQQRLYTI